MLNKRWSLFALQICLLFGLLLNSAFAARHIFTQAEQDWLNLNHTIKVAVSREYAPISFMQEKNQFAGISADYLALIENQLKSVNPKFKFDIVVPSETERNSNDPLNKNVDMVVDFVETPDRLNYWRFTKPYIQMPLYLIVRQDSEVSSDLNQLSNKKIAVVKYYAAYELLKRDHPNLTLVLVDSSQDGLKRVAFGEVQGFVSDLPVASYWSAKAGLSGLKAVGELPYTYQISFASNKQEAILHGLLEKTLQQINPKSRQEIHDRWLVGPFADKSLFKDTRVWLILAGLLAFAWLAGWYKNNINNTNSRLTRQQNALALLTQDQFRAKQDKSEIFKQYAQTAAQTLDVERVGIWLFDDTNQKLNCVCLYTKSKNTHSILPSLQAKDLPIYFNALETNRVIAVDDATQHAFTKEFTGGYLQNNNIGAMLDGSIRLNGKTVGVVCHEHVGNTRAWTLDEQSFAGSIADLCRITLETYLRRDAETALKIQNEDLERLVDDRTKLLLESEKRYSYIVENAPIPILIIDHDGAIVDANPEAESSSGFSRQDLLGKNFTETLVAKQSRSIVLKTAALLRRGGQFRNVQLALRHQDGKVVDYDCSIGLGGKMSSGKPQMVAIAQDISRHKALEASLIRAREAAESADRIKSVFVASMSHELRTPLNSIIGFLGVVLNGMSGELNAKQKDQLGRAYNSSKHLLALITDVIDISKIEAGFLQVHMEKFALMTVMTEVGHAVQHLAEEKGLSLSIDCPADIKLETDRKRLFQVILNVVSNGLKYTEQGGVKVTVSTNAKNLTIKVEDTGIGIKEADLPSLFKTFVRIDSPLRIKTLGTGLGLYLTRRILTQLLGGKVSVTSIPEVGSIFTINLPIKMPKLIMQNNTSILEDTTV